MNAGIITTFIFTVFALGFNVGAISAKRAMKSEAIESNCAKYNPKTSEFEWIKEKGSE